MLGDCGIEWFIAADELSESLSSMELSDSRERESRGKHVQHSLIVVGRGKTDKFTEVYDK